MAIHAPEAAEIAVRTVSDFITRYALPEQVYFVCYDEETARLTQDYLLSKATTLPDKTRPERAVEPLCARHPGECGILALDNSLTLLPPATA